MHFPNLLDRISHRTAVLRNTFWSMLLEKLLLSSDVDSYKCPSYLNTLSQDPVLHPVSKANYEFGVEKRMTSLNWDTISLKLLKE